MQKVLQENLSLCWILLDPTLTTPPRPHPSIKAQSLPTWIILDCSAIAHKWLQTNAADSAEFSSIGGATKAMAHSRFAILARKWLLSTTLPMCRKRYVLITSCNFRHWDVDLKKWKKDLLQLCDLIIPRWRSGGRRLLHIFIYIHQRVHALKQLRVVVMASTWPCTVGVALSFLFSFFPPFFSPSVIFTRRPGNKNRRTISDVGGHAPWDTEQCRATPDSCQRWQRSEVTGVAKKHEP